MEYLAQGLEALKQQRFQDAINALEYHCQLNPNPTANDYLQAQMSLVQAYQHHGQLDLALERCAALTQSANPQVQQWAQAVYPSLQQRWLAERANSPEPARPAFRQAAPTGAGLNPPAPTNVAPSNAGPDAASHMANPNATSSNTANPNAAHPNTAHPNAAHPNVMPPGENSPNRIDLTQPSSPANPPSPSSTTGMGKAGRAAIAGGTRLAIASFAGNLALASGVTLSLLLGMVLVLVLSVLLIQNTSNPFLGLIIALFITIGFNGIVFFLSPVLMDLVQRWLYGTQWVTLADLAQSSPETAQVIEHVCRQRGIRQPRLGLIDDQNPTAFTYGSLPNSARLVVSRGLFTYLDDDEVAAVYAHELGHIVHWDFAIMTLAATLVQILFLLYSFARQLGRGRGNSNVKNIALATAAIAYLFYWVGTYLVLYLSRTREYYADHFAAETTGNPNGLSRALVKIAYGIVTEAEKAQEPSRLIEGTRALGIYDPKAATSTGTAYRMATQPERIGRVFLWDMFNPWAWWMELNSTHPLTGKRVRALSTYAEQLGLPIEFDMGRIIGEGKHLDKRKLYAGFILDALIFNAPLIGVALGILVALLGLGANVLTGLGALSPLLMGWGMGLLVKMVAMFPDLKTLIESDVLTLMANPYASPLRGQPVRLTGQLIGRGDAGSKLGSDLKIQDPTGLMYLRYSSRFGPIGNALFGWSKVKSLLGEPVQSTGWFRRGVAPWVDLAMLHTQNGRTVKSYHRFWTLLLGGGSLLLGVVLLLIR
jgi:Zn-dependent protease with chaperone function